MKDVKHVCGNNRLSLIPYYPNYKTALAWYQDLELCRQVDNITMYHSLDTHGDCYDIQYEGNLVGDVTLQDNVFQSFGFQKVKEKSMSMS